MRCSHYKVLIAFSQIRRDRTSLFGLVLSGKSPKSVQPERSRVQPVDRGPQLPLREQRRKSQVRLFFLKQ